MTGAERELEFASGHQLDPLSAEQIPSNIIAMFLDDGDLQKLHRMLIKKRPPAPALSSCRRVNFGAAVIDKAPS